MNNSSLNYTSTLFGLFKSFIFKVLNFKRFFLIKSEPCIYLSPICLQTIFNFQIENWFLLFELFIKILIVHFVKSLVERSSFSNHQIFDCVFHLIVVKCRVRWNLKIQCRCSRWSSVTLDGIIETLYLSKQFYYLL